MTSNLCIIKVFCRVHIKFKTKDGKQKLRGWGAPLGEERGVASSEKLLPLFDSTAFASSIMEIWFQP